jgi:hypothetical protein
MIGEREIMIDVFLLPEMSRAEQAGRARKNEQFPLSCPQAAPPRRGGAIGRSSIVATLEEKSLCITPSCLYPASRVSGHDPVSLGNSKQLLLTPCCCGSVVWRGETLGRSFRLID